MDHLWAPWRMQYISRDKSKAKGCVFCRILKEKKDKKNYLVKRFAHCYSVLNIYPYNNGHVLVLPNRHVNDLSKMKPVEKADFFTLVEETKDVLQEALSCDGFNIGMNIGRFSGAGFPGHIHMHIVPRWRGDVNFMPVTARTKVISQSLDELYERLMRVYKKRH